MYSIGDVITIGIVGVVVGLYIGYHLGKNEPPSTGCWLIDDQWHRGRH